MHRAGPWPWEQFFFPPSQRFWSAIQGSDAFSVKRDKRQSVLGTFDLCPFVGSYMRHPIILPISSFLPELISVGFLSAVGKVTHWQIFSS